MKGEFQGHSKCAGLRGARAGGAWVSDPKPRHNGEARGRSRGPGGADVAQGCKQNSGLFKAELC